MIIPWRVLSPIRILKLVLKKYGGMKFYCKQGINSNPYSAYILKRVTAIDISLKSVSYWYFFDTLLKKGEIRFYDLS